MNCKRPGHNSRECPHILVCHLIHPPFSIADRQCPTCGKEDDHERRDCPYNLICFRCGLAGHKIQVSWCAPFQIRADIQDCSKPRTKSGACEKCGAGDHTAIVSLLRPGGMRDLTIRYAHRSGECTRTTLKMSVERSKNNMLQRKAGPRKQSVAGSTTDGATTVPRCVFSLFASTMTDIAGRTFRRRLSQKSWFPRSIYRFCIQQAITVPRSIRRFQ